MKPGHQSIMFFVLLLCIALISGACKTMAPQLPMPRVDPDVTDRVTFELSASPVSRVDANSALSTIATIRRGSSVVIDIPAGIAEADESGSKLDRSGYSTSNASNAVEQAIEKQLIRNNFVVKDRSKFEAILRNMRERNRDDCPPWANCNRTDPRFEPLLNGLEQQYFRGEISDEEYAERVTEYGARLNFSQRSRERGENEIVDTPEMIRAASTSGVRSDYMLQINYADKDLQTTKHLFRLFESAKFRSFVDKNGFLKNNFNDRSYYECNVFKASLNAELIHLASGELVWIGNHTLTEIDTEQSLTLEVAYRRHCSNCAQIMQAVRDLNTEDARIARYGKTPPRLVPEYEITVIGPRRISGYHCAAELRTGEDKEMLMQRLANRVANDLIQTIRFTTDDE